MRRLGALFAEVASVPNLWRAWRTFRRGKRSRPSVRAFELDTDREILALHRALLAGTYRPRGYRLRWIREPKRRLIAAAPVRDRIVHHAVYRQLAPRMDPGLIDTTYACLPDRGSHRAILAFQRALRHHRYVLCLDIRHYFLSIDLGILLDLMGRKIKDARLLGLLATIAESGDGLYRHPGVAATLELPAGFPPPHCGLPIGNLTSQWWGNHYLSGFDHFVKRELKIPHYQRYMDDLTLFADSSDTLRKARQAAAEWLWRERRLRLKRPGAEPRSTRSAFTYLGHRVSRRGTAPTRELLSRMTQRVSRSLLDPDPEHLRRSIASYRGIVGFPGRDLSQLEPPE